MPGNSQVIFYDDNPIVYLRVGRDVYCYDCSRKPIGEGSMGRVYVGFNYNTKERIAIKQVSPKYARVRSIRERARQEASLRFRHRNLVEMLGYCEYYDDEMDEWSAWILSKFVEGITLDKHCASFDNQPDKAKKVAQLMLPLMDALDYLHKTGVVHRDIKPSNIIIEPDGNPKLMDLGIARLNEGNKYSINGFIGTPLYAAPEQILRDDRNYTGVINGTTDIYALAMTLYVMIVGSHPFEVGQEVDILAAQMTKRLPDNKEIPRLLMQVILKATEKDQTKRYQSASEMKTAIEEALNPPKPKPLKSIKLFIRALVIGILSGLFWLGFMALWDLMF